RGEYAFTSLDWQFLRGFADQAAIAVRNARLYTALERERSRLAAIIQKSADGIMILDSARTVIIINQTLTNMTGIEPADAVGMRCDDVLSLEGIKGVDLCDSPDLPEFVDGVELTSEADMV